MAAAYALIFYRNAYDKVHTESTKKRGYRTKRVGS